MRVLLLAVLAVLCVGVAAGRRATPIARADDSNDKAEFIQLGGQAASDADLASSTSEKKVFRQYTTPPTVVRTHPRLSTSAHAEMAESMADASSEVKVTVESAADAQSGTRAGWTMPPTTTAMEPPPIIEAPSSYPNPILPWDIHKLYQFRGWNVQHDPMYWDHWLKWHYYQRNFPNYKGAYQPPSYSSTYTDPYP
eukprot:gnl/Hemi2/1648_TR587_c0_g3_i1.p1 gnl/Hemi2/1648_TR587_c0_g3~~gnl/Hemi2/1648_TR587_c0_g3_i1.p1  ORF type:complete len:205 (+),score=72.77 gnl/Hemi2/1648_TR587_c0_g3_i1:28-615(+)